jgi:hypothetical protein
LCASTSNCSEVIANGERCGDAPERSRMYMKPAIGGLSHDE